VPPQNASTGRLVATILGWATVTKEIRKPQNARVFAGKKKKKKTGNRPDALLRSKKMGGPGGGKSRA